LLPDGGGAKEAEKKNESKKFLNALGCADIVLHQKRQYPNPYTENMIFNLRLVIDFSVQGSQNNVLTE
jgi:hypothetical protein